MSDTFSIEFQKQLVNQAPLYLVYLSGILFALKSLKRLPRPSVYALVALVLFLLSSVSQAYFTLQLLYGSRNVLGAEVNTELGLSTIATTCSAFRALGTALLLLAVYVGRDR